MLDDAHLRLCGLTIADDREVFSIERLALPLDFGRQECLQLVVVAAAEEDLVGADEAHAGNRLPDPARREPADLAAARLGGGGLGPAAVRVRDQEAHRGGSVAGRPPLGCGREERRQDAQLPPDVERQTSLPAGAHDFRDRPGEVDLFSHVQIIPDLHPSAAACQWPRGQRDGSWGRPVKKCERSAGFTFGERAWRNRDFSQYRVRGVANRGLLLIEYFAGQVRGCSRWLLCNAPNTGQEAAEEPQIME
jgi:hypothetical protein